MDSFVLCFLYRTVCGRMLLKLLIQPKVSKAAGRFLSSGVSKWVVPYYIWKHEIDMSDIEIPQGGFSSFNDFFTRKRKTAYDDLSCGYLISPCDGFLTPVKIRKNTVFHLKNTEFSLEDLLKDKELAKKFYDGTALIFRLTPANYHRYCYAADGKLLCHRKIGGKLHCVRPIALRTTAVFTQNSREYTVIKTNQFGTMIQMEIGALLVGKIQNHRNPSSINEVRAGAEKGYFEFGGSTIVILFQKGRICFPKKLYERRNSDGEIPVRMGENISKIHEVIASNGLQGHASGSKFRAAVS